MPGFVLLDADGEPVEAWVLQSYSPPYGESPALSCVPLNWIGQLAAWELKLDLTTGTFAPCYDAYPTWTAAAKAVGYQGGVFNSPDCTGTAYASFTATGRVKVAGVLYEPTGAPLGPIGAGTGEPASFYELSGTCTNASAQSFSDLRAFAPVSSDFAAAFDNPPYSLEIAY